MDNDDGERAVKRRARTALSCQRCRKHRSKCSRSRPSCEQCIAANEICEYLQVPGDLESTALRDRFEGLQNQIHSLVHEFSILEDIVRDNNNNNNNNNNYNNNSNSNSNSNSNEICTNSLSNWHIHQLDSAGLSIDTHMFHVSDIYSTLIEFAKDNSKMTLYPEPEENKKPVWLTRNNKLFRNVRLSHFTSLKPEEMMSDSPSPSSHYSLEEEIEEEEGEVERLPDILVDKLFVLYKDCLLYGAVQPFDTLFKEALAQPNLSPTFQLLYASIICHMLPHAFYWHHDVFDQTMSKADCERISAQYYAWAKRLLSSIYFDTPSLMTCHAICNLVLYHMEYGNTSVVYIYSGMAVRMALSLQLYREDALESVAQEQVSMFPSKHKPSVGTVKKYARSLLWFMYFLDTASSHYHDKPYEIHLDDHVSTTTYFNKEIQDDQSKYQYIEFQICQITRDIRRTIFNHPEESQTSYKEIERIEKRLLAIQKELPSMDSEATNIWQRRSLFKQWIRHHGHWILIHQTYLPTPMSVQRCTTAAFALVELFDHWEMDCYFRPCVHELKQACEILLYHVDQNTPIKSSALTGLTTLMRVLLKMPVGDIARTRPFVQKVLNAIKQ